MPSLPQGGPAPRGVKRLVDIGFIIVENNPGGVKREIGTNQTPYAFL
jgi:hypothetical protein